jgi:hypothetical protein
MSLLASIFLGWPAIVVTLILTAVGLWKRNYKILVVAAFLALPFSWFLSGFPRIQSPVFLLPVLVFSSAYAQYKDHEMIAWLLAVPFFLSILLLFYIISAG